MENRYTCYKLKNILSILLMLIPFVLKAQPANDAICSATTLTVNSNNCTSGTNAGATTVAGDPLGTCWVGGTKSHTVWYSFVAPESGNITVTTDHTNGGTLADPQLAVFSSSDGTCSGTLTELDCNDDITPPGNTQAAVTLTGLTSGTTYFVELDGYSTNTGSFCIDVHDGGSILTNDNCENAMNLWVGTVCNFQSACTYTNLTIATSEIWETVPACWTQGTALNTVWYKFTAADISTTLKIEANGGPDPHAAVYTGACGNLTLHACQEDLAAGGSSSNRGVDLTFSTNVGEVYYIQYDSDTANSCNNICLLSTGGLTTPANDACAAAVSLSLNTTVAGNNWLSTADGGYSCGSVSNSVWYKFTPASTGSYYFTLSKQEGCTKENNTTSAHTGFYAANVEMIVYNTGTCTPASGNEISCTSNLNTNDVEIVASLTAGNTYLVAIDGLDNTSCSFEMTVSATSVLPVSLVLFEGQNKGKTNMLNWSTVSESNNDFFTIERSTDASIFEPIGIVKGAGNSNIRSDYIFTDHEPLNGTGYYRLVQTDYDGKTTYPGSIIALRYAPPGLFTVYPNPNNGRSITISIGSLPEEELRVTITDLHGQVYYSKAFQVTENNGIYEITDSNLPPGMYLITGKGRNQIYKQKLIVTWFRI